MVRVVSFNINGIRARFHQLDALKAELDPDIIGFQEIKVHDDQFPFDDLAHLDWHFEIFGQKGHYGVALASKKPPEFVQKGFPSDAEDAQRRLIHARYDINGKKIDVLNGYFPQGESRKHETKFPAKEKFYKDLINYLEEIKKDSDGLLVMGDMNISPTDFDIGIGENNRKRWLQQGKCSFLPEEREWYDNLMATGLKDTYRHFYPESMDKFSWFDYRSKGFNDDPKRGLRIDHILVNEPLLKSCQSADISYSIRGLEKPSDHAPIWADFDF